MSYDKLEDLQLDMALDRAASAYDSNWIDFEEYVIWVRIAFNEHCNRVMVRVKLKTSVAVTSVTE